MDSNPDAPEPGKVVLQTDRKFEDEYECLNELGRGKFGSVYQCRHKQTDKLYAAKVMKVRGQAKKEEVEREVDVMNKLCPHPKLLFLHAAFHASRSMVLVMEYVAGGELLERVCGDDYVLTEADCIMFLRQLCQGVSYMHSQGVVHLDLKPENVLCEAADSNNIKIIDFGLARFFKPGDSLHVMFGTPEYIAPEVINYDQIGFSTDMWSVGVIAYILLSGLSPFLGDTDDETLANVTRGDYDFDDDSFDVISDNAKDFIGHLLLKRKESRMSGAECLKHAWLTQPQSGQTSRPLNTDNLKAFVAARRKLWQKTGQAIMAINRMASLGKSISLDSNHSNGSQSPTPSTPTSTTTPTPTATPTTNLSTPPAHSPLAS